MKKQQLIYSKSLPNAKKFPDETILFYDKKTLKHKVVQQWLSKFKYKIALNAGESVKTLESYAAVLTQVQKITQSEAISGSNLTFLALGGGSIGDFVGFLASTFQRGKKFISIPSTWLAAIDSAHGGKNGLNLNNVKNQVGTFYPADQIYICESLLKTLPQENLNDAYSEALKICIINQPKIFFEIQKTEKSLFKSLPKLIDGKYKVTEKDPLEKKGLRKILNLGHTMGHVFETMHQIPHGQAVFFGMLFSLRFSLKKKYLTWDEFQFISEKLFSIETDMTYQEIIQIPMKNVQQILLQDKKMTSKQNIDFVFVRKLGSVILKSISVSDIIKEILRQQQEL